MKENSRVFMLEVQIIPQVKAYFAEYSLSLPCKKKEDVEI